MLPYWSSAVTVMLKLVPAVVEEGAETMKWVAPPDAALTVIGLVVPVIVDVTVSVAVIVWEPAVFSVTVKELWPLVRPEFAGKTAWLSLEVRWAVPE